MIDNQVIKSLFGWEDDSNLAAVSRAIERAEAKEIEQKNVKGQHFEDNITVTDGASASILSEIGDPIRLLNLFRTLRDSMDTVIEKCEKALIPR